MENCLLYFLIRILDVAYNFYHWYYTEYRKRDETNILLVSTGIPLEWKDLGRSFKAVNSPTVKHFADLCWFCHATTTFFGDIDYVLKIGFYVRLQ